MQGQQEKVKKRGGTDPQGEQQHRAQWCWHGACQACSAWHTQTTLLSLQGQQEQAEQGRGRPEGEQQQKARLKQITQTKHADLVKSDKLQELKPLIPQGQQEKGEQGRDWPKGEQQQKARLKQITQTKAAQLQVRLRQKRVK